MRVGLWLSPLLAVWLLSIGLLSVRLLAVGLLSVRVMGNGHASTLMGVEGPTGGNSSRA